MTGAPLGWLGIVRLGLVQTALGAIGLDLMLYNLDHSAERLGAILEAAPAMGLRGVALATTDIIPMATVGPQLRQLQHHAPRQLEYAVGSLSQRSAGSPSSAISSSSSAAWCTSAASLPRVDGSP